VGEGDGECPAEGANGGSEVGSLELNGRSYFGLYSSIIGDKVIFYFFDIFLSESHL
jgi:hypothetical protein